MSDHIENALTFRLSGLLAGDIVAENKRYPANKLAYRLVKGTWEHPGNTFEVSYREHKPEGRRLKITIEAIPGDCPRCKVYDLKDGESVCWRCQVADDEAFS